MWFIGIGYKYIYVNSLYKYVAELVYDQQLLLWYIGRGFVGRNLKSLSYKIYYGITKLVRTWNLKLLLELWNVKILIQLLWQIYVLLCHILLNFQYMHDIDECIWLPLLFLLCFHVIGYTFLYFFPHNLCVILCVYVIFYLFTNM